MRQTACGKHGQLLSADKSVKSVNCRNTRLDKLVGVIAGVGVDGLTVDVHALVGNDRRTPVDRLPHTVENTSEHVFRHGKLQASAKETCFGGADFQSLRTLEQLHQRAIAVDFQHFALADFAVFLLDFHKFVVADALYVVDQHKRSDNFSNCFVFFNHRKYLYSPVLRALISFLMLR